MDPLPSVPSTPALAELRASIACPGVERAVLPFGVADVDVALPGGGLALGALHEVCDAAPRIAYAANAALFVAGILARIPGPVLWCLRSRDLFAPALARVGLHPDRVVYCETWKDSEILPAMEDGLRCGGLAGVVGELNRLSLTPSRRLQLAAEQSGVTALVIRRSELEEANAAHSRWRITSAPSADIGPYALARPRWLVELMRCRGAEARSWVLEACNAQGHLALPADLADRSGAPQESRRAIA